MCFFHVIYNVKKNHLIGFDSTTKSAILTDIKNLYHCPTQHLFNYMYQGLQLKWNVNGNYLDFRTYFHRQWIEGTFNNWQLFHRGPGIPGIFKNNVGTNNSLEGFNNIIKNFIGKSKKYQIVPLMESM
jgi:hypothetical protein